MDQGSRPLSIAFVAPRYHTNMLGWVRALRSNGVEVHVLVSKTSGRSDTSDVSPVQLEEADWREGKIVEALLSAKADAVVIRNPMEPFGRIAVKAARQLGIHIVLYTQGPYYRRDGLFQRVAIALYQKRCGGAPWITPVLGRNGSDRRPNRNWHYVPFSVETDADVDARVNARSCDPAAGIRIVMVAKYMERKNHLLLVKALERLQETFRFRLDLVGGGYPQVQNRVRAYLDERGIEWVRFVHPMPHAELQRHLYQYDLFVLPSRDEAVGVSVLEAMGKGLPVVCSDTCGAQFYVEDGGNGCIFRSDDADDLGRRLAQLLADPGRLREMGRRSLELVRANHSPEKFLGRFLPLVSFD